MSIKEILEELPKLTPEERQEIRDWLEAEEFPETDELIAAVDKGIRSSETEQSLSIEEARELIRRALHGQNKSSSIARPSSDPRSRHKRGGPTPLFYTHRDQTAGYASPV